MSIITPRDIYLNKQDEQVKQQKERNTEYLHLSQLAICGYKYRYELEHNLGFKFRWSYMRGLAIENAIWREIQKINSTYETQYDIVVKNGETEIRGHPDFFSESEKHIIELKTSKSRKYKDIYERQLWAYMIFSGIPDVVGSLWFYDMKYDTLTETKRFKELKPAQFETVKNSIESFTDNEYKPGIENSLCGFCPNENCPMYHSVKNEVKGNGTKK